MRKLPMTILSVLLFGILVVGSLLLFAFTPKGNSFLEPYVKQRLEERTGLPVEIKAFKMALNEVNLTIRLDNRITLDALSNEGIALLQKLFVKKKKINFRGTSTSLGGKIDYQFEDNVLYTVLTDVPLLNILDFLDYKQAFTGETFGKGWYDVKQKSGVLDLEIDSLQIKSTPLTDTINMLLGADLTRVIFTSTKLHAQIKNKNIIYTFLATGSSSSITIREGMINRVTNEHRANFTLMYEKYTLHGKIKGSADHPKVTFDTPTMLAEQFSKEKLKENFEKALGGKAEKFLKGLSF